MILAIDLSAQTLSAVLNLLVLLGVATIIGLAKAWLTAWRQHVECLHRIAHVLEEHVEHHPGAAIVNLIVKAEEQK